MRSQNVRFHRWVAVVLGILPVGSAWGQSYFVATRAESHIPDDGIQYSYNINTSLNSVDPGFGFAITEASNDYGFIGTGTATTMDTAGTATSETVTTTATLSGFGSDSASSLAQATLGNASLGIAASGTGDDINGGTGSAYAQESDLLTFSVPGATATTVTDITVTLNVDGSAEPYTSMTAALLFGSATFSQRFSGDASIIMYPAVTDDWQSYSFASDTLDSIVFTGVTR